jgi:hypothetical protein
MLEERYALGSLRLRGKSLFINTPQGRQAAPQTKCSSSVALFFSPSSCLCALVAELSSLNLLRNSHVFRQALANLFQLGLNPGIHITTGRL